MAGRVTQSGLITLKPSPAHTLSPETLLQEYQSTSKSIATSLTKPCTRSHSKEATSTTFAPALIKHDVISDGSPWFADVVADVDQMQILLNRIREIMPEAIQMGELRLKGQTDAVIADALGIPRTTLLSRLKRLRKMLDAEVSDIL